MATTRKDSKAIVRVAIIGCGNIGSLWDESDSAGLAKTHAKAFATHPQATLVSMMDVSKVRAEKAASFWKVPHFTDSTAELLLQNPDIVCLCTPEKIRLSELEKIPEQAGLVIVCEKPLASSLEEASKIEALVKRKKWHFLVNYTRRYGDGFIELKKIIDAQVYGKIDKIICQYGKGLRNNGTHIVDTLNYLLGPATQPVLLRKISDDRATQDPTTDLSLQYSEAAAYLIGTDHRNYTVFEMDLHFNKGRVCVSDRGHIIETWKTVNDPVYPGYTVLQKDKVLASGLAKHFENMADRAVQMSFEKSHPDVSSLSSAIETLRLIDQMKT